MSVFHIDLCGVYPDVYRCTKEKHTNIPIYSDACRDAEQTLNFTDTHTCREEEHSDA